MKQFLTAAAAIVLLGLAACSDDSPEESAPATETASATTPAAEPSEESTEEVGLTVGGAATLTISDGEREYDYNVIAVEAKVVEGEDYIIDVVEFTVEITVQDGELNLVNSWSPWIKPTIIASDGTEYEQATAYADMDTFGTITAGETATGAIGFEAPASVAESGIYRLELVSLENNVFHDWTY